MVSAAYDHLVAIIVVGVIFIATVAAMPFATFQIVDQQQLRNTALNVFDSMLLNVGSPSNWGSILSDKNGIKYFDPMGVKEFGLADADPFSKFVLDSDKVQRLSPSELNYSRVCDLLGIQGSYGFRFTLSRPFRVAWNLSLTENLVYFSVTVTRTEDGTPIPNAAVKVTTMVTAKSTKNVEGISDIYEPIPPVFRTTDIMGNCQGTLSPGDLGDYALKYAVAIMEITVAGMSTTVVAQNDSSITQYMKMSTYGETVMLSIREDYKNLTPDDPGAEREILDVEAYDSEYRFPILEGTEKVTWGKGYENVSMTFPGLQAINPTVLLMVVEVNLKATPGVPGSGGPTLILIAGPLGFAGSGDIFEFGGDSTTKNPIAIMRRLVVIADMTYVASIAFWRE